MKKFEDVHARKKILYLILASELMYYMKLLFRCNRCVRWDQNGERLASALLDDGTVKVLDFASGKVTYTGKTEDGSKPFVISLFLN